MSKSKADGEKRGRPRRLSREQEDLVRTFAPDIKSAQGRHNWCLAIEAINRLDGVEGLDWLRDSAAMLKGDRDAWKPGLLSELGRFEDPDAMLKAAAQICALKPSVSEGAKLIRQWRTGKRPKHEPAKLSAALCDCLNGYMALHPDCPLSDIADELWRLWGDACGMDHEPEEGGE